MRPVTQSQYPTIFFDDQYLLKWNEREREKERAGEKKEKSECVKHKIIIMEYLSVCLFCLSAH